MRGAPGESGSQLFRASCWTWLEHRFDGVTAVMDKEVTLQLPSSVVCLSLLITTLFQGPDLVTTEGQSSP